MELKKLSQDQAIKISSGQVIISLVSATKELIENSLDAGATYIGTSIRQYHHMKLDIIVDLGFSNQK